MSEIKVSLDRQDFSDLINGKIVSKDSNGNTVKIILKDIGFNVMDTELDNAINKARM